jgi:hypothetical protein
MGFCLGGLYAGNATSGVKGQCPAKCQNSKVIETRLKVKEVFEDTKGVIRIHISKKN